jgi:NADH-quinone oxidoreductase subunit C
MNAETIFTKLQERFPDKKLLLHNESGPYIVIEPENLLEICDFLKTHSEFWFDYLIFISALDFQESLQAVYALASYKYNHVLFLKVALPRDQAEIPSLYGLWSGADWHERETYDLFGIKFTGHPDLQRIMMPPDWEGYPLRKDYRHPNLIRKPDEF